MRVLAGIALMVASLAACPVEAGSTVAENIAVKEAEVRGALMYAYDQAAWHSSDRFTAEVAARGLTDEDLGKKGVRGYVVEPSSQGHLLVTFYSETRIGRFAFARYRMAGSKVAEGGLVASDEDAKLSITATRLIDARDAAIKAMKELGHGLCSKSSPNTLVLPPDASGNISAYIMTSTTVDGIYPAGGHYRYDFDAKGQRVADRRFMKSCFDVDSRKKAGSAPLAVFVTHLLDAQPTEVHVFVSLNAPVRLFVGTVSNRGVWKVEAGRIEYVQSLSKD